MSVINVLALLLFISTYMMLIFDQNRFIYLTVDSLIKKRVEYYELEGWLYYAIAFYKDNYKNINLPYLKDIDLKDYKIIIDISNLDNSIYIKVSKYIDFEFREKLACQIIVFKDKFKIEKIY